MKEKKGIGKRICFVVLILLSILFGMILGNKVSAETYYSPNSIDSVGDNYAFDLQIIESKALKITERNQYYAFYVGDIDFEYIDLYTLYDGDSLTEHILSVDLPRQGNFVIIDLSLYPTLWSNWRIDLAESCYMYFTVHYNVSATIPKYPSPGVFIDLFKNEWELFDTVKEAINGDYFSGFKQGILQGDIEQFEHGKEVGVKEGIKQGYDNGYNVGEVAGYNRGLAEGDINTIGITSFIPSILGSVFGFILTIGSFEVFGISLLGIVALIGVLALAYFILKWFL